LNSAPSPAIIRIHSQENEQHSLRINIIYQGGKDTQFIGHQSIKEQFNYLQHREYITSNAGTQANINSTIIISEFNSNNGGRERSLQERRHHGYTNEDGGNPKQQTTEQTQAGSAQETAIGHEEGPQKLPLPRKKISSLINSRQPNRNGPPMT
jgi:hypothetical protein